MKEKLAIEAMRTMATEALEAYNAEIRAGGEPNYPAWTRTMLIVCDLAQQALMEKA